MQFNTKQQQIFDRITGLLFKKLLLLGNAGTGKTAVLAKALSELVRRGNRNIVLCAPTHLARLNLIEKLDQDVRGRIETTTVSSLLMKFGVDDGQGGVIFTSGKLDKINKYSVVALDECSMVGDSDYQLLMASRAKIIFLGDFAQLPPVMAKSSESRMDSDVLNNDLEVFTLTQQMRQKGLIHTLAEINRTKVCFPTKTESGGSGESIVMHSSESDMVKTMIQNLIRDERGYEAVHYHRFITYKNSTANAVSKTVRDKVLANMFGFDPTHTPFVPGEMIMMRENKGNIGYNGELVKVILIDFDGISSYGWGSYSLSVQGNLGMGKIRVVSPVDYPLVEKKLEQLQHELKGHQIRKETDQAVAVLDDIKHIKSHWVRVQYPYGVTTHKSQGMTLENVYLNTQSFVHAPSKRALLYVGISRASKNLHAVTVPVFLDRSEVNERYRRAREAYEGVTGQSYRDVVNKLKIPTGSLEGKEMVSGYLECLVEDLNQ